MDDSCSLSDSFLNLDGLSRLYYVSLALCLAVDDVVISCTCLMSCLEIF